MLTIHEAKRAKLKELGAELRAIGVLSEHLTDTTEARLNLLAQDIQRVAGKIRLLGR